MRNARRNENLLYLSEKLKGMGFDTFLAPEHLHRVYFEFLIRYIPECHSMSLGTLIHSLQAEGCEVDLPRYPLVHQQPLFVEGHFARIARLEGRAGIDLPTYRYHALPNTEAAGRNLIKLPNFPSANRDLLDQYVRAFQKVLSHAKEITEARGDEG